MPPLLEVAEFLLADLPLVANFSCGIQPWEIAMSEWIKAPETAKFGNSQHQTSIWLYYHPDGRIVGFGSLGITRWKMPYPDGDYTSLSIIPALAIQTEFQNLPPDCLDNNPSFSHQLLADLIGKATMQAPDTLVLFVHRQNQKAIDLYNRFGFKDTPSREILEHKAMQKRLR
jgi:ribosomal protein S18 acetylase RimI-like enzyme